MLRTSAVHALALFAALATPAISSAQQNIWGGTGSTTSTSDMALDTNWSTRTSPSGTGGTGYFTGLGNSAVTLKTGVSLNISGGSYLFTGDTGKGNVVISGGSHTFTGSLGGSFTVGSGASATVGTLTSTSPTSTQRTLAINGTATVGDITQSTGALQIVKSGTGTMTLTGTSSATGATTVNAGTFLVNGTYTSANAGITVNGGTLGGTGTINRTVNIGANGTLDAGDTFGVLTLGRNLSLAGTTRFDLGGTTLGTRYDSLVLTNGDSASTLTYGGALSLDFTQLYSSSVTLDLFQIASGMSLAGSFASVNASGLYSGSFTNNSGIWSYANATNTFSFDESTGDLTITAVPEPSTYAAAAGLSALAFAAFRRRRAKLALN